MPPAASIALLLDAVFLLTCLLGAIVDIGEGFWRVGLVGEKSMRWDSDLNESTSLWWRFFYAIDRTVDLTQAEEGLSNVMQEMKIQHSKQTRLGFYVET